MNSSGVGDAGDTASEMDVAEEVAVCVAATTVPTVGTTVCMPSVGLVGGIDGSLLQDVSMTAIRSKEIDVFFTRSKCSLPFRMLCQETSNGMLRQCGIRRASSCGLDGPAR